MKLKIATYMLFAFMLISNFTEAMKLNEIIPSGFEIRDSVSGNLNNDAYPDMILVLKRKGEDSLSAISEFAIKRETVILYGTATGYTVEARNMNAVYCFNCGGPLGDPYTGITIKDQTFTITHYGGGVWRWARTSTFSKNKEGVWVLTREENETFNAENQEGTKDNIVTTPTQFGTITFQQYDIDKE